MLNMDYKIFLKITLLNFGRYTLDFQAIIKKKGVLDFPIMAGKLCTLAVMCEHSCEFYTASLGDVPEHQWSMA